jgi:Uma2 family endonuclease
MATVHSPAEQTTQGLHVVLDHVSWKAYEALLESWAEYPRRLTYDRGRLEIMCPLHIHERCGKLMGRLIEMYTWERDIPLHSGGSTTFKQAAKQKGLEPDECYWIQNEPRMRGSDEHDLDSDPPPDLAVEVDITSSSLDRMSIYADLGVLEVWRYKDGVVTIHLLRESGQYELSDTGRALPPLTGEVVTRFLNLRNELGDTGMLKAFVKWVREQSKVETSPSKPKRPRKK